MRNNKFFICDDYIIPYESVLYVNAKKKWLMLEGGGSIWLDDDAYDAFIEKFLHQEAAQCNVTAEGILFRESN